MSKTRKISVCFDTNFDNEEDIKTMIDMLGYKIDVHGQEIDNLNLHHIIAVPKKD